MPADFVPLEDEHDENLRGVTLRKALSVICRGPVALSSQSCGQLLSRLIPCRRGSTRGRRKVASGCQAR